MKTKTQKPFQFTIPQYTCMAIAFLAIQNIQAEVIYTDVDPDILLDDNGEVSALDMDLNGTIDFAFLKNIGAYYTDWGSELKYFTALRCGPQIMENEVAGSYFTVGSAMYSSYITERPYALPENFDVDIMLSFQNDGYQLMAKRVFNEDGDLINYGGNWWPEKTNAYIGVHFMDADEKYHYGWIRVTVSDSTENLIIHDYAYELSPETGIKTGSLISTSISSNPSKENINIYCDGNVINIITSQSGNSNNVLFELFDIAGIRILSKQLLQDTNQIQANLPSGTYLAKCTVNGKISTKKIVLF